MATKRKELATKYNLAYEPVIEQAPLDTRFHEYVKKQGRDENGEPIIEEVLEMKVKGTLITSLEQLKEYAEECKGKCIAVDTETTGICFRDDFIVGFSIAYDAYDSGIYVPIRHQVKTFVEETVPVLNEDGTPALTKTGKPRKKKVKQYEYAECDDNLPAKEALDILYDIMLNAKVSYLHNSEFDLNMIKKEGYDITKLKTFDTIILPYLYDAEGKGTNGLKFLAKRLLGRHVPEFKDALGGEENFRYTDPKESYSYACYDAADTFGVFEKLYPMVKKLISRYEKNILVVDGKKYDVISADNKLIRAFVDYYGHCILKIDRQVAIDYKEKILKDLKDAEEKIYGYFGKKFNLSKSSKEFKETMKEFNIDTGVRTDTGNVAFGDDGLKGFEISLKFLKQMIDNKLDDIKCFGGNLSKKGGNAYRLGKILLSYGKDYFKVEEGINNISIRDFDGNAIGHLELLKILPEMYEGEKKKEDILKTIRAHGSLMKALNSYIDKLTQVDECRMRYRLQSTASGRLSSGNSEKSSKVHNNYYIDLNAQNLTKPHSCLYKAEESSEYGNILGWKFTPVTKEYAEEHPEEYIVEGSQKEANIRRCIVAPSGVYKVYIPDEQGTIKQKFFKLKMKDGSEIIRTKQSIFMENKDTQVALNKSGKVASAEFLGEITCKEVIIDGFEKLGEYNYIVDEVVKESRYILSCDYSSEEYIALATLSRDSVMLDNFRNGIDPHTASAWAIFGKENYSKENRKKAKIFNFANNYGGTEYAISNLLEISPEEASIMVENYNNTFIECTNWKKKEIEKVFNYYDYVAYNKFGRPRQFKTIMNKSDNLAQVAYDNPDMDEYEFDERIRLQGNMRGGVERRIISHIIQSSCGDICRYDLLKLYNRFFKDRNPDIDFVSTIHDEIVYSISKSKIVDFCREIEEIMKFDDFDKSLPIKCGIAIGDSYGYTFEFVWADETKTKLVPERF